MRKLCLQMPEETLDEETCLIIDAYRFYARNADLETGAEDRTVIINKNKPTFILTTCYPFNFSGSSADCYIVQTKLASVE